MPGPSLEEGPARQADRSRFRQSIRGAVAILAIHADGILVVFSRGEATRRRDARDRGASRDLRHKPVARRYLRRAPPGPVRVATRARAGSNRRLGDVLRAFRYAIVYGPRRKCPEKSRVDSCTLSHHQRRDDDDLAPICGFCAPDVFSGRCKLVSVATFPE